MSWNTLHGPFYQKAGGDVALSTVGMLIEGAIQGYLVGQGLP